MREPVPGTDAQAGRAGATWWTPGLTTL